MLAAIALFELCDGLSGATALLGDVENPRSAGAIIRGASGHRPVLALSALMFAAIGYVRHAILALGAVVVMTWLDTCRRWCCTGSISAGPLQRCRRLCKSSRFP